jgi:hypothetical protein
MDQTRGKTSFAARGDSRTFSEAEFKADGAKVVAHAAATGTAVVAASDGRPVLVISIPTEDLPVLDR